MPHSPQPAPQQHANPWTTLASKQIYENPWITVTEHDVLRPDGAPGIYGVVHFKNKAVGVLPVAENGDVWLVGQFRYPLNAYSWEIPEGGCPVGESPEECARRELAEETGLVAGKLEPLATAHLSNSVSDEWGIVYRGTELTHGPADPEPTERLEVKRVPFDTALAMLENGEITDSLSVIALLREALLRERARRHATSPPTPRALKLRTLAATYAIVRLEPLAPLPAWATSHALLSSTRTDSELSLVVDESALPADQPAVRGWAALSIQGTLDLAETGILASILAPLAQALIPIFALSTHDTDCILIPREHLARARDTLLAAGHSIHP